MNTIEIQKPCERSMMQVVMQIRVMLHLPHHHRISHPRPFKMITTLHLSFEAISIPVLCMRLSRPLTLTPWSKAMDTDYYRWS